MENALSIFESSQSFDYSWLDASAKCINKLQTERNRQYIVLSGSYAAAFEQDYERLVVCNMYLLISIKLVPELYCSYPLVI